MDRPEKLLKKIPAGKKDSKVTKETNVSVQNKKHKSQMSLKKGLLWIRQRIPRNC